MSARTELLNFPRPMSLDARILAENERREHAILTEGEGVEITLWFPADMLKQRPSVWSRIRTYREFGYRFAFSLSADGLLAIGRRPRHAR